jgi:hypothetical protein
MKVIIQNPGGTIGLGMIEPGDQFVPIMIVSRDLLKELTTLIKSYAPDEYEIGTTEGPAGGRVLTLKPYNYPGNSPGAFLLAGMDPVEKEERAKKAKSDPGQTKISSEAPS